jgi:DNA mismatch repair protein MSH4
LEIIQQNQQIEDSHTEIIMMSDTVIRQLTDDIRTEISSLYRTSDGLAILDMLASFAHVAASQDYVRPTFGNTTAIKSGRHPIREKIYVERFIPNDVFANNDSRFQIVTGCNMSGKSTYIRSIALLSIMAQVGSFVPAQFACFPMRSQLFARIALDDSNEANVSTFAMEMREAAFIVNNVTENSLIIIDELGRGTSTTDGLAIAIAIAEALIESRAHVWFTTHFHELAHVLAERSGVVNLYLEVDLTEQDRMTMLFKVSNGFVKEDHYGLALARVMTLPSEIMDVATRVSETLIKRIERKKMGSKDSSTLKRRRLVLALKQQLIQAEEGILHGKDLADWLRKLQAEFVSRMSQLDTSDPDTTEISMEASEGSRNESEEAESSSVNEI